MNSYCECPEQGFCQRFQREMRGRFWEICQGINVDPGTAAVFRSEWDREAGNSPKKITRPVSGGDVKRVVLRADQQPGDLVAMTAAIHSLHEAYPDEYSTAVMSRYPAIFDYNPNVENMIGSGYQLVHMHYPAVHQCNDRGIHFMQAWCEHLSAALGVAVPLLTNRPHLYFSDPAPTAEDFWVVCSGSKSDFTNKQWGGYQDVVDTLRGEVRFIQIGSAQDNHVRLRGAENMVGQTTLRQLFGLVRRARGVLCGVSLLMHVAAALEKPAVVVAGGREPVQWNAYPKQQYVHTVGALPCTDGHGHVGLACWRARTVPLGDGSLYDRDTCEYPMDGLPACMRMIHPEEVAGLVRRYNNDCGAGPSWFKNTTNSVLAI